MYVENLRIQDYEYNKKHIHQDCSPDHWKETQQMVRIPIQNIDFWKMNPTLRDLSGEVRHLRDRTQAIIRYGSAQIHEVLQQKPLPLVRRRATKSRIDCLVNTISYQL